MTARNANRLVKTAQKEEATPAAASRESHRPEMDRFRPQSRRATAPVKATVSSPAVTLTRRMARGPMPNKVEDKRLPVDDQWLDGPL